MKRNLKKKTQTFRGLIGGTLFLVGELFITTASLVLDLVLSLLT